MMRLFFAGLAGFGAAGLFVALDSATAYATAFALGSVAVPWVSLVGLGAGVGAMKASG